MSEENKITNAKEFDKQYPLPASFWEISHSKVLLTYKELHDIIEREIENRRPSSGSPLPVELDKRELITIQENELSKMQKDFRRYNTGHFNLCTFQLFANVAQAICSRFSQKKVTEQQLSEIVYPFLIDKSVIHSWEQSLKDAKTASEVKFWEQMVHKPKYISIKISQAILDSLYSKEKK